MKIYCFRCKGTTKNANTQIFLGKNVFLYKKCAYFILRPDSRLLILGSWLSPPTPARPRFLQASTTATSPCLPSDTRHLAS